MSQRYFSNGLYSLNIRNCSDFHVLMRNTDESTNFRAASKMNLKKEIQKADELTEREPYPYFFIDKSINARLSGVRVFIDLFSDQKKIVMKEELYYLISYKDFNRSFSKVDNQTAIKNENEQSTDQQSTDQQSGDQQSTDKRKTINNESTSDIESRVRQIVRRYKFRSQL